MRPPKPGPFIAPVENHRQREKGLIVYPVYSRRSGGLSVGVNLFPGEKLCSFDCPYCEVFPFPAGAEFSPERMEAELRSVVVSAPEQNVTVKDICFSGNGEPTLSPAFPGALELAGRVHAELVPGARLVLITNGAGLLNEKIFSLLRDAALGPLTLDIWLKTDAGTPGWYEKMNRSSTPFEKTTAKAREFIAMAPVTIQTMLCASDGEGPPPEEETAWINLILDFVEAARVSAAREIRGGIRKVQIYGKARPAPEDPKTTALPRGILEERAEKLRTALAARFPSGGAAVPAVEVYE